MKYKERAARRDKIDIAEHIVKRFRSFTISLKYLVDI